METRYGVKGTETGGVFFTESQVPGGCPVGRVQATIRRQNSNLDEVKSQLASQAVSLGANVIMNFKYGQKKHWIGWDSESWYGEGDAVRL